MSFLTALTEKPWESQIPQSQQRLSLQQTRRSGLRLLLVVISMLFFLFLVAFLMRSQYPDWQPLAEEVGHPLFDKSILWINSTYLLLASICIQWARMTSAERHPVIVKVSLSLGGLFAMAFVAGQLLFWQQLYTQGHEVDNNPALSFFYLFTGLHAAHVGIGIVVWLAALVVTFKDLQKGKYVVELSAIYWHFLLGLWVVLFALLVSKPETYNAIAEFCGLR